MALFSQKKLTHKQKEIVHYIQKQREEGHKDGRIRTLMEVHGHTPEDLNLYFELANERMQQKTVQNYVVLLLFAAFFLGSLFFVGENTGLTGAVTSTVDSATSAVSWRSIFGSDYECGDDYPADEDNVIDLSYCVGESLRTKNYLFCYVNNSVTSADISPSGSNDDWYSTNLGEDISSIESIDTVSLLESSIVFPWRASYDNVDCFSWDHGTTRTEDWHLCNATESDTPPNLVFYYADVGDGSNVSYGGLSTSLVLNSSYYLCYDELECTTETSACDEDAGSYCVGRLDSTVGSSWYPCDTTLDADYYRCCEGGCDGVEMECPSKLLSQDESSYVNFTECVADGTTGCCDDTTDCVYGGECYNYLETTDINNITLQCREGNNWCSDGFTYDADYDWCEAEEEACYDSLDEAYCNTSFDTTDMDTWEADSGCTRADPEGTYYYEGCILEQISGMDYYFYQDITWY